MKKQRLSISAVLVLQSLTGSGLSGRSKGEATRSEPEKPESKSISLSRISDFSENLLV